MVILSDLLGNKTQELYVMALNRGRLLEELVNDNQLEGGSAETMFLFGLLSLMEAMLDTPMADLLHRLPIHIKTLCRDLKLPERELAQASVNSLIWAIKCTSTSSERPPVSDSYPAVSNPISP